MKHNGRSVSTLIQSLALALLTLGFCDMVIAEDLQRYEVQGGTVKFVANTNLSAISVHGQSAEMTAELELRKSGNQTAVDGVQARIDPTTFSTGMSLRDSHMRSKIFTDSQNQLPPMVFVAGKSVCPALEAGKDESCSLDGQLSLRGISKPFTVTLKIRNDGKGGYRATGDGALKLSAFGIEPPCQLGVCVKDEVALHFEFQARERMGLRSGGLR